MAAEVSRLPGIGGWASPRQPDSERSSRRGPSLQRSIAPAAAGRHQSFGIGRSLAARLVPLDWAVLIEHRLDDGPRRLHAVLAREEHAVPRQRVAQQPLVRGFVAGMLVAEVKLVLSADERLPRLFDASCKC